MKVINIFMSSGKVSLRICVFAYRRMRVIFLFYKVSLRICVFANRWMRVEILSFGKVSLRICVFAYRRYRLASHTAFLKTGVALEKIKNIKPLKRRDDVIK